MEQASRPCQGSVETRDVVANTLDRNMRCAAFVFDFNAPRHCTNNLTTDS
jgi:hypothetical protein